jgi:hypothetical protein
MEISYYTPSTEIQEKISVLERKPDRTESFWNTKKQENITSFTKWLPQLAELQDKINDFDNDDWVLTEEEIQSLLWDMKGQRLKVIASLENTLTWNDWLTEEEIQQVIEAKKVLGQVWEVTKDIIIPEWYEVPLILLPVSQEIIVWEKLAKIVLVLKKALPWIWKSMKMCNFWEKWLKAITNAFELASKWDLRKLRAIIKVLMNSWDVKKVKVAEEMINVKREIQLIKTEEWREKHKKVMQVEKTVVKDTEKTTEQVVKAEKKAETKEWIEAYNKLEDNLNPYFWKWKDRYSEFKDKLAQEVENFEKRYTIKHNPVEEEKYVTEFKHLLESYW